MVFFKNFEQYYFNGEKSIHRLNLSRLLLLTPALLFLAMPGANAQIELHGEFQALLEKAELEFIQPVEARYKDTKAHRNRFQPTDFAMRSRAEKLEIRYLVYPYNPNEATSAHPHLRAVRLLVHLATNDQSFVMSGKDLTEAKLKTYNADWGKTFFFTPKAAFSNRSHCKMLALHKAETGTAFVFFLFDKAERELDYREYTLKFQG